MMRSLNKSIVTRDLLLILSVLVFLYYVLVDSQLSHDVSWYLVSTRMWLNGGVLYENVMEINPPLAFYTTVPALLLADLVSLDEKIALIVYTLALSFISLVWTYSIIGRLSDLASNRRLIILIFAIFAVTVSPIGHFGQREHLFVIGTLPLFTFLVLSHYQANFLYLEKLGLAVLGLIAIALKPYFLIPYIVLILFRIERYRKVGELFSSINITLLIGCLLYVGFSFYFHPVYFTKIIPFGKLIYGYSSYSIFDLFFRASPSLLLLLGLLILTRRIDRHHIVILMVSGVVLSCYAMYFIQWKGWYYHLVPAKSYAFYLTGWIIAIRWETIRNSKFKITYTACFVAVMLLPSLIFGPYHNKLADAFLRYTEKFQNAESVLVLSTNVSAAFPFVNESGLTWSSRWSAQWMIPNTFEKLSSTECTESSELCDNLNKIYNYARSTVIEDFENYYPDIVFIDNREQKSYFGNYQFNYINFLKEHERFDGIWKNYIYQGEIENYSVWNKN